MKIGLKFNEIDTRFKISCGEIQDLSDGGFERGYTQGYEQGRADYERTPQEKSITIVENGSVEIVPDDGCVLSKAVVSVSVASDDIDQLLKSGISSIDSQISSIRAYACYSMVTLKTVNLPNVTKIDTQTFRACTQLSEINAPLVTYVGTYTFYTCSKLKVVDFPRLTTIEANSFTYSTLLDTFILRSPTVANLVNTNAFTNTPIARGTGYIYVPDNLVDTYKVTTNWSFYANQIKPISALEG